MVTNDLYFSVSAQAPPASNSESTASCPALPRPCPIRVHWFFAFFQPQLTLAIHPLPYELTLAIHPLPSELTLAVQPLHSVPIHP